MGNSHTKDQLQEFLQRKWIRIETKKWYGKLNSSTRLTYLTHLRLGSLLHPTEMDTYLDSVAQEKEVHHGEMKTKKNQKLQNLSRKINTGAEQNEQQGETPPPPHRFFKRLENLSSSVLSKSEEDLLKCGLKHSLPPLAENKIKDHVVADLIAAGPHYPDGASNRMAEILHHTNTPTADHKLRNTVKRLRHRIEEDDIIITKADKGNTVVVMNRVDYLEKTDACLSSINATAEPSFSFNTYNEKVRRAVNGSKYLLKKEPLKKALLVPNPQPPAYTASQKYIRREPPCAP